MRKEPEVVTVTLKKHNGMGLSIVAAKVRKYLPDRVFMCVCLSALGVKVCRPVCLKTLKGHLKRKANPRL